MHPSVLAQHEISAQEGLELLKAYTGISDPSVRAKILTWVIDAHAGATGSPTIGPPERVSANEGGANRVG